MPGLGTSFGRGGATTFQQDLQNSDCILIMGSNMAEAHPVGFQWVVEAKERGAKVFHVDPRFTRTSALADRIVASRADTWQDIDAEGRRVSRTLGIAGLGGATLDNEENYLIKKLFTAMGAIQIENQARI